MKDEIEHSRDLPDNRCVQWQDNAGCCTWPCEVETVRRQRDALAAEIENLRVKSANEYAAEIKARDALKARVEKQALQIAEMAEARGALAEALMLLVYLLDDGDPTEAEIYAVKLLDAHAPGWRSSQ